MTDTPILRALSIAVGAANDTPDGELLRRFVDTGDQDAFELVLRRHAELVWGTCRAALPRHADAENAFQAVFLILARKAASVRDPSAAGWLFRVARRVALRTRELDAQRSAEPLPDGLPDAHGAAEEWVAQRELAAIVVEEVARLAAKYREPVVLCLFEGHTHLAAAARLGWPVGTVASRLARAKDMLRDRLTRRGVAAPAAGLVVAFAPTASAALIRSTFATAIGPPGAVPPSVLSLTNGALFAMRLTQLKMFAAAAAAIIGLAAAIAAPSALVTRPAAPPPAPEKDGKDAEAKELKALQGKWRVISTETAGGETPAHLLAMQQIIFEGDVSTFKSAGEVKGAIHVDDDHKARVRLAPGKLPKEMDVTPLDGTQKGVTLPRIYKLDGDTLTICSSFGPDGMKTDRPKEFKVAKDVIVSVLERVKGAKDELKALAGEWKGVSASVSGKAVPADEVAKEKWVIKGAELALTVGNSEEKAELTIDPSALPPTFDFTITEGKEKGSVLRGIYFRQGDKLTLAIRDPKTRKNDRPTELKPGEGVIFEVLERRK